MRLLSQKKIFITILILFSILVNQYYGNRGVFPIDSFLIFDAAFNIISGNHPFRDYWLITGPFVDYVQSFFFLLFGINWTSYVLHASILNMALVLFSFYFFLNIGLKNYYAFIYALGVAILAYPSIGIPFADHHSVIFSIMACFSISLAILKEIIKILKKERIKTISSLTFNPELTLKKGNYSIIIGARSAIFTPIKIRLKVFLGH